MIFFSSFVKQKKEGRIIFSFRTFLLLVFSFFSIISLTYAATTIGNDIFTSGTITSQGKAYLTGGVSTPVLNATSSLIDNLTVGQNASLATTTISDIFTTQAPVNFTNGMVSVKAPFDIEEAGKINPASVYPYSEGIYVSGHYAYLANYYAGTMNIIDISNSANPVLMSSISVGGYAAGIYVSGHYAYVAAGAKGLDIIDVSNPAAPVLVGNYDTAGTAQSVYVSGKYAYVADEADGLDIIDVSNPAAPVLVGNYDTAGTALNVYVSGKYAYVVAGDAIFDVSTSAYVVSGDLYVIDISNPATPILAGSYTADSKFLGIYVSGRYAYVAATSGLNIFDVSDPASPVLIGSIQVGASNIFVSGHYAYLLYDTDIFVVDISNPAKPVIVSVRSLYKYFNLPGSYDIFVKGNKIYIADYYNGLLILSLSGISAPTANLGNIQSNNLDVTENTNLNQLNVSEGLTVGKSALFNSDVVAQKDVNILHNLTVGGSVSAADVSSAYATSSAYVAVPTIKFIPTATPTSPHLGQCFMDNGAKPQVSCYDGAAWHTLW